MVLENFNIKDVVYMYATCVSCVEGAHGPGMWDCNTHMTQVSFMAHGTQTHIVIDGSLDTAETPLAQSHSVIYVPNENQLLERAWYYLNNNVEYVNAGLIAGWDMRNVLWPRIVGLGLSHAIWIDPIYRSDPTNKYRGAECLVDLSEVYWQGAHPMVRPVPPLDEYLHSMRLKGLEDCIFADKTCLEQYGRQDWDTNGLEHVASTLVGLEKLMERYYASR